MQTLTHQCSKCRQPVVAVINGQCPKCAQAADKITSLESRLICAQAGVRQGWASEETVGAIRERLQEVKSGERTDANDYAAPEQR